MKMPKRVRRSRWRRHLRSTEPRAECALRARLVEALACVLLQEPCARFSPVADIGLHYAKFCELLVNLLIRPKTMSVRRSLRDLNEVR